MTALMQRGANAAWWSAVEISARYGVQLAVTIVLARLLTPSDFGLMAMLLVFITFATLLAEGGLGTALVQKQVTSENEETSVFLISLGMGVLLALILSGLAPAVAAFYGESRIEPLLDLAAWLLPCGALITVPNALLSQQLRFRERAGVEMVASIGSALVAISVALAGFGVWALVWQALVGAVIRAALLWRLSGWKPIGSFDSQAFSGLFRFSSFLLLANVLSVISTRIQSLLIGKIFDARELGLYSMAQDTQQAPTQFMSAVLNRVGLPMLSKVATQPVKFKGVFRLALRLSMFLFAPGMAGLALLAQPLVLLLLGGQWIGSAPILSALALAAIFWPLHVLNLAALGALGRSDLVFRLEVAKAVVTIPLIVLASPFGVFAVACAVLASSLISLVINTWYSKRLFNFGLFQQLYDVLPPLLLTVFAVVVAVAAWSLFGLANNEWVKFGFVVVVVLGVYLLGSMALRLHAWRDFVGFHRLLRLGDGSSRSGRAG